MKTLKLTEKLINSMIIDYLTFAYNEKKTNYERVFYHEKDKKSCEIIVPFDIFDDSIYCEKKWIGAYFENKPIELKIKVNAKNENTLQQLFDDFLLDIERKKANYDPDSMKGGRDYENDKNN